MPIISHTGAHTSAANTARQERISLGLTTVRRKITVSAGQIGSRVSRGTISGSRASQALSPTSSQCPSPRISIVTAPGVTPSIGPSAIATLQENNTPLDSPQKETLQSSFTLVQRKLSTVVSPQLCDTDGCDSRKTSGPVAPPDLLTPPDSSSLRLTHSRSPSTAHIPIAIHIQGPDESSNELSLAFPVHHEHQLLGVDTVGIPVKKHSTSARVTNLRAQAEQLRRMRSLTEKRPEWLVRLIEVLEDRRDEIGVEIETPLFVQRALNVFFLVSGLALLGGVIIVIVLSLIWEAKDAETRAKALLESK